MKKILMVGMGAIGATYASLMKDRGIMPMVLCSGQRKIRYEKDGFNVNGKRYDFECVTPENDHIQADLMIVSVKYHHLSQVVDQMKNFVSDKTVILSLMNGIDSEEIIGARYGMDKMVHAFVAAIDAVRTEQSVTFTSPGRIVYGIADGGEDDRTDCAKAIFEAAGITGNLSNQILKDLWWKFMANVGANQVSAILETPYGVLRSSEPTKRLLKSAMMEVIALSDKLGIGLEEASIEDFFGMIANLSADGITSMHQDMRAKRKTEVEMLSGKVIEMGQTLGVPTPVNQTLFDMIQTLELLNDIK